MPLPQLPPPAGTGRITWRVTAFFRREVRRQLLVSRLPFTEEKGLLDSLFIIETPDKATHDAMLREMARFADLVNRI
jgi:hypothetical protein